MFQGFFVMDGVSVECCLAELARMDVCGGINPPFSTSSCDQQGIFDGCPLVAKKH